MLPYDQPLVTIAIPTRNRADNYLKHTLTSALNQTYQNVEIIVSDNCSDDDTKEVVAGMDAPNIRYFRHQADIGANNNFNFSLKQAKGDYLLMLHDDDLIDPDFVQVSMRAAAPNYDTGIIRTGTRLIDGAGRVIVEIPNRACDLALDEFFLAWFNNSTSLYLCSTLFHTNGLRAIGGFNSRHNLFQDVIAEVQLAARSGHKNVPDVKASSRKHRARNTDSARVADWCEDSLLLLDLMCELAPKNKRLIRQEGLRFLARLNYSRDKVHGSRFDRFLAYLTIYRRFNYRYIPPPVLKKLAATPVYRRIRKHLKR